jgi:malonyl CoA-acyl carrier protein transacylase
MGRIVNLNTAFLFPGQGAQKPGMLHELIDHPAVELSERYVKDRCEEGRCGA